MTLVAVDVGGTNVRFGVAGGRPARSAACCAGTFVTPGGDGGLS